MTIKKIENYRIPKVEEIERNQLEWEINPQKSVLLIHDMQNYFINFFDDNDLIKRVIENIKKIKKECKNKGIQVIYTAQPGNQTLEQRGLLQDFWGDGIPDNGNVQSVIDELAPEKDDIVLTKWRYSAFTKTNLHNYFKENEKDTIIITGVYSHIGCIATACDAFMNEIKPIVISDANADFSREEHISALNYVTKRCGVVQSSEELKDLITQRNDRNYYENKVKEHIYEITNIEVLDNKENLIDIGLDSIRIMLLADKLRMFNENINFITLINNPNVDNWVDAILEKEEKNGK